MNLQNLKEKYELNELELFSQDLSTYKVLFSANHLKQSDLTQKNGCAVRLINKNKLGFASALGEYNLEDLILKAKKLSEFSPETDITFPHSTKLNLNTTLKEIDNLELFKNTGFNIIEKIKKEAPEVLADISFDFCNLKEEIKNSNDLSCMINNHSYSFSLSIKETNENNFIEIFTAISELEFSDYNYYVNEVINLYNLAKTQAKIKHGRFPVLFTSKAGKELFDFVEDAINGKLILEGSSPWTNKLNQKILSEKITIKQDPSFGFMARPFDDEGVEIKPINFINKGYLENFYFDLNTKLKFRKKFPNIQIPSGNGFRPSISSQADPSTLNMIVTPGTKSLDEIIRSINYGLLVDQTMGGLSANISGEISVNIDLGFLIEKGEIIGRVKNTMISGNVYDILNNVSELSNNPRWYWSNTYNPDLLVEGFNVISDE